MFVKTSVSLKDQLIRVIWNAECNIDSLLYNLKDIYKAIELNFISFYFYNYPKDLKAGSPVYFLSTTVTRIISEK